MDESELRTAARKVAQKINDDLTRKMFGAYTNAPERPEPSLSLDTLRQALDMLGPPPPSMEIYITEYIQERDEKGPVIIVADNPTNNMIFRGMLSGPTKKAIIMHPQTFLNNRGTLPVGIPVYGYEAVTRWLDRKVRQAIERTLPTIRARWPYVVVTAVLLVIVILIG